MADGATTQSGQQNTTVTQGSTAKANPASLSYKKQLLPNLLNYFSLYNYNLSLSVLDDESFNNATYKKSGAKGPFLAYSASQQPENRVDTVYGKFDFFIEDLKINHVVGFEKISGNTNALGFNFRVIEPYSMGLFFVALQQDALAKGHKNYLDAPLLLTLEFKGHISVDPAYDAQNISLPSLVRHFPLKLRLIDMKVTSKGCEYEISAYPANESAFEKAKITLTTAVSIAGRTVETMLKTDPERSLEFYLNQKSKDQKGGELVAVPDQYIIEFPDCQDGTPNPIKLADMGFSAFSAGETPFAKDNFVYENGIYKRGNIQINPKEGEFRFAQGSDVINAINQVILMSEYGRTALTNISADGFVNWWRIEVAMHYISSDANLATKGVKPKKYFYRIIPYRVSSSHFLPPNEKLKGADVDQKLVVKEYNYIYSGQNTEILNFDINFKAGFYTALYADGGQNAADKQTLDQSGSDVNATEIANGKQVQAGQSTIGTGAIPGQSQYVVTRSSTSYQGGGGIEDSATIAARQFHDAITSGVDIVNVDMTILGDPYYIGDSGIGNYHSAGSDNMYVNDDGAMNWDNGEIHITLNFRTPVDINLETGRYKFDQVHQVTQFSGLYRVLRLESMFSGGKFTQTLKILRLKGQEAVAGTGVLQVTPAEKELRTPEEIQASKDLGDFAG